VSAATEAVPAHRGDAARRLTAYWYVPAVAGVLALAVFLDFFRLDRNGYANTYYSAAVRSMLESWHNFFFVSFDPGGLVSVDKPPLALWLEAASAKVFGFSGTAILLPEAAAGVAAVWVLYLLVARHFGRVAGVAAALALAVSPVSVSVNRDNNPDALLALLLVLAAYVGARAVESGRLRTLLLTAVIVGLAFNTKMLAAMIVLPGIALAYLLFTRVPLRRRLVYLLLAGVVLVAVSGAWIAAVDLTPASQRPYVGSTTNNSALSLALDYNGLGRVTGQTGGTSSGGGLGGAFSGSPGVFRLLNQQLGDQGGWLLAFAILGGISAVVAAVRLRRWRELAALTIVGGWFAASAFVFSYSSGIIHTYYVSALAPAACALVGIGAVALWRDVRRGGWWLVLPIAALVVSCAVELTLLRRTDYVPALQPLVVGATAIAVIALCASTVREVPRRVAALVAAGAIGLGLAGLLVAPAVWSSTTLKSAVNGVFPGAGPDFVSALSSLSATGGFAGPGGGGGARFGTPPGGGGGGSFAPPANGGGGFAPPTNGGGGFGGGGLGRGTSSGDVTAALRYVENHGAASRFGLIVTSEQEAAQYVIDGEPVAAMGGFTGRETVLTPSYLSSLVRSGDARYFLLSVAGGFGGGDANNTAIRTITSVCKAVPSSSWNTTGSISGGTLYDCAGKADAIAASG